MFWNEAELAELEASSVLQKIGKAKAEEDFRQKAWNFMMADLEFFEVDGDDEDEWEEHAVRLCHYAGSLIMAYAFDIDRDDEDNEKDQTIFDRDELQSDDEDEPLKGLVPFADMLNADAYRNNVCRHCMDFDCTTDTVYRLDSFKKTITSS
jgi:N-lysine methyltransferase SETD6